MVKIGYRTPSLRKRIAARTSLKRVVRHSMGVKAPKGMGWLTNPKKAAYNRVYNRTTKGCALLIAPVALLVVAALGGACAPDPPRLVESEPIPTAGAAVTAAPAAVATPDLDLERTVADQAETIADLEAKLDAARAQTEAAQAGLGRCVEELNRVAGEAASAEASAALERATRPRRATAAGRVYTLGAPTVTLTGTGALAVVRIWNAGDAPASGEVEIQLMREGEVVDSTSEWVEISPRTDQVVTATFTASLGDGTYSARAVLGF